ncbi:hybrid sensor histidine kinase/response regulator [Labilibacter marinus]|uniref:hybrid sensor histidine kinase/response regulator n=1 Tax=Labilibacter marinus TaxID=1477105 RepID=UPI00094F9A19|nr:PAS domain-containing hybrid sensor histidine kinase/response regulator [Labilibacter marinus]
MNDDLIGNWKGQLKILQELTKALNVVLLKVNGERHEVVTSAFSIDDSSDSSIDLNFGESNDRLVKYQILSEDDVWGLLVLIFRNGFDMASITPHVNTIIKIISDQLLLEKLKTSTCNNSQIEPIALDYFLEAINGVPWRLNLHTNRFTYIGDNSEKILSYTLKDWPDLQSWSKTIHHDDREKATNYCFKRTVAGDDHVFEYRLIKKDGSIVWIRDIVKLIIDSNKKVRELSGLMVDITHVKEKELELELLNNRLKFILKATNTELSIVDENGRIIFHSHEDVQKITQKCHSYYAGLNDKCDECPRRKSNKSLSDFTYQTGDKTIQVLAYPFEIGPGIWHMAEVRMDVTKRHNNEKQIELLKNTLEFSMDAGRIAFIEYDLHKGSFKSNQVFKEITGFDFQNEEVAWEWLRSRIHTQDLKRLNSAFNRALKSEGKRINAEFQFLDKSNEYIWVKFTGQLLPKDNKEIHITGVLIDITDTKKLMAALLLERNKSLQASETKSMFLANMSHEIRTPMNAITGFAELLTKYIKKNPYKDYLDSIKSSGNVLLALINDLLDLEKIEAGKMIIRKENTNFVLLLKEMEQTFSMHFKEKNLKFKIKTPEDFPKLIYIDSLKIKQILINLVTNAIKFTSEGCVEIQSSFTMDGDNTQGILTILVKDTGIGIEQSKQESIFEPFVQDKSPTQKNHQGTGLGLSIVQNLVKMMGGKLALESRVGAGSSFIVNIPYVKTINKDVDVGEEDITLDIRFNKQRVLIIDNVKTNLLLLSAICANLNLECYEVLREEEALGTALEVQPDLIFMDIRIPKSNDYKVLKSIREKDELKDTPVIAVSSSSSFKRQVDVLEKGFNGYISKPIAQHKLINEIQNFIKSESAYDCQETREAESVLLKPEDFSYVKKYFVDELVPRWRDLLDMLSTDELNIFIEKLEFLNHKVEWSENIVYTKNIKDAFRAFDFEEIQKLLTNFNSINDKVNEL